MCNNYILSIGVDKTISPYEELPQAINDAIAIYDFFSLAWDCLPENKILLLHEEATRLNLRLLLQSILVEKSKKESNVLIYLSGHLVQDVNQVTGFFLTQDADDKLNHGLNVRDLRKFVEDSNAGFVIVIIDGCYSGIIGREDATRNHQFCYFSDGIMDTIPATKIFLTSSTPGKRSYIKRESNFSSFTNTLFNCLCRNNILGSEKEIPWLKFYADLVAELEFPCLKSGIEVGNPILFIPNGKEIELSNKVSIIPSWARQIINIDKCRKIYNSRFISESPPDGSTFKVGEKIKKIWRIQNIGEYKWENFYLKRDGTNRGQGSLISPYMIKIPDVEPGDTVDIEVEIQMPPFEGEFKAIFKFTDEKENYLMPDRRGLGIALNVIRD